MPQSLSRVFIRFQYSRLGLSNELCKHTHTYRERERERQRERERERERERKKERKKKGLRAQSQM